jgi:GTP-binding protein EngB required for normal cell division
MGQVKSKLSRRRAIDAQQILPEVPKDLRFRVLIIGRANAGKTSILQRVCDTTESPGIFRLGPQGERERVRSHSDS